MTRKREQKNLPWFRQVMDAVEAMRKTPENERYVPIRAE